MWGVCVGGWGVNGGVENIRIYRKRGLYRSEQAILWDDIYGVGFLFLKFVSMVRVFLLPPGIVAAYGFGQRISVLESWFYSV